MFLLLLNSGWDVFFRFVVVVVVLRVLFVIIILYCIDIIVESEDEMIDEMHEGEDNQGQQFTVINQEAKDSEETSGNKIGDSNQRAQPQRNEL